MTALFGEYWLLFLLIAILSGIYGEWRARQGYKKGAASAITYNEYVTKNILAQGMTYMINLLEEKEIIKVVNENVIYSTGEGKSIDLIAHALDKMKKMGIDK